VRLATTDASGPPIYHLLAHSALNLGDLVPVFASLGLPLATVSLDDWTALARTRLESQHDESLAAVVTILSRHDTTAARPKIEFAYTLDRLRALDTEIRPVTRDLLRRYLAMLGIGRAAQVPAAAK
jgi:nonribosomal peptide synthetase DhbF